MIAATRHDWLRRSAECRYSADMLRPSLSSRLIILKLGGSLLTCPDLSDRIRRLIRDSESSRILIVVGGGTSADVVRDWSRRYALPEESAHWIALRSLSVTRALVKELLPECAEAKSLAGAVACWLNKVAVVLLDLESHLREAEFTDRAPLPHQWSVTSDSIAAWVAARWSADELILLKSTNLPADITLDQACRDGLVDSHFPDVAIEVPRISWCNLLSDPPRIQLWRNP